MQHCGRFVDLALRDPNGSLVLLSMLASAVAVALTQLLATHLFGLRAGLLVSAQPPRGRDSFREWLERDGATLGSRYASELERNFRGRAPC